MKKNKALAYIVEKKYYLSLLACLVVTAVALIIIYTQGNEEQEIANLNDSIRTEELVENPVIVHEEAPEVSIHQENVDTDLPITIGPVIAENPEGEEVDEEVVAEVEEEAIVEEAAVEEDALEVMNPIITVNQPNLSFDGSAAMLKPLEGSMLMDFDTKTPSYFKTLNEYRLNTSLLIAAEVGTEVKAAADGVVEEINYDYDLGNYVTIFHGNGYKTIYGQLQETMNVKEGDTITKGQIIGYVEKPTINYSKEGSHLNFQVLKDGEPVNPEDFME